MLVANVILILMTFSAMQVCALDWDLDLGLHISSKVSILSIRKMINSKLTIPVICMILLPSTNATYFTKIISFIYLECVLMLLISCILQ